MAFPFSSCRAYAWNDIAAANAYVCGLASLQAPPSHAPFLTVDGKYLRLPNFSDCSPRFPSSASSIIPVASNLHFNSPHSLSFNPHSTFPHYGISSQSFNPPSSTSSYHSSPQPLPDGSRNGHHPQESPGGMHDMSDVVSTASSAIAAALGAASATAVKVMRRESETSTPTADLLSAPSEDFIALCEAQLELCSRILNPEIELTVRHSSPKSTS